jgi:hypothetical protein
VYIGHWRPVYSEKEVNHDSQTRENILLNDSFKDYWNLQNKRVSCYRHTGAKRERR